MSKRIRNTNKKSVSKRQLQIRTAGLMLAWIGFAVAGYGIFIIQLPALITIMAAVTGLVGLSLTRSSKAWEDFLGLILGF